MARIRTIKPEFWTSEQVVECSLTARLLFVGLWNFCDDGGVHPYALKTIKMEIFPGDDISLNEIEACVSELLSTGLLKSYHVEDKRYLFVTGWHHQRIDKPNKRYPNVISFDDHSKNDPISFDDHSKNDPISFDDHSTPEGKGREGKGSIKEPSLNPNPLLITSESGDDRDEVRADHKQAFLKNLKDLTEKLAKHYPQAYDMRQITLFIEANIRNKHPSALKHCLQSLLTACEREVIKKPRPYMEAALKIEDGKYNAKDEEMRCNNFKNLPQNTGSVGSLIRKEMANL